ncbi:MAG: hypothetical protein ACI8PZ_004698, partial [Myxococcota bacterium]
LSAANAGAEARSPARARAARRRIMEHLLERRFWSLPPREGGRLGTTLGSRTSDSPRSLS